eukprot:scaffold38118_cov32-Tisochrysis_lutea.AAC.5
MKRFLPCGTCALPAVTLSAAMLGAIRSACVPRDCSLLRGRALSRPVASHHMVSIGARLKKYTNTFRATRQETRGKRTIIAADQDWRSMRRRNFK